MSNNKAPYRYDVMGSFLRPEYLKKAREDYRSGSISADDLRALEDKAIRELIARLAEHGYKDVTDGEFRRGWYHSDFLAGLKGVDFSTYTMNLFGHDTLVGSTTITDKIAWNEDHPFIDHFKFAKSVADEHGVGLKFDIPGPNIVLLDTITTDQENYYGKDYKALAKDFVDVFKGAIKSLHDAGCDYLQIDDPVWVSLCDPKFRKNIMDAGFDIEEVKQVFSETASSILEAKPEDMAITLHLCQGNMRSMKFYDTGYDEIAGTIFALPFDGYFIEFDDEKYCDFSILEKLHGQKVALGLVSTRSDDMEDEEVLLDRIERASKYYPRDLLCVSTQCGFASTSDGNIISEEAQWKKLDLVRDVAIKAFDL